MTTTSPSHTTTTASGAPPWARKLSIALVIAVVGAAAAIFFSPASGPKAINVEGDAQQVFTNVMSPFCPGMTIATCTSSNAADVREEVRVRLGKGETAQAIEESLYTRFGNEYRAVPQAQGRGMIVWVFPLAAMVVSGAGFAWFAKRARERHVPEPVADTPIDPALARRLDDELDDL
ncbi:MAG: cytochrome c-type biogenesis protein CcmH [Acidobacteria bacterium]|jgi:cytochrome c-type biogenesis protein CcmH|nr:cytochrome c-type biogenesis protein CcmH [Acidobacteriota bacterium]